VAFHCKNGYTNASHCYVITLPILLWFVNAGCSTVGISFYREFSPVHILTRGQATLTDVLHVFP